MALRLLHGQTPRTPRRVTKTASCYCDMVTFRRRPKCPALFVAKPDANFTVPVFNP
jgi:hypothetical protein